jgi:DNA polymerase V
MTYTVTRSMSTSNGTVREITGPGSEPAGVVIDQPDGTRNYLDRLGMPLDASLHIIYDQAVTDWDAAHADEERSWMGRRQGTVDIPSDLFPEHGLQAFRVTGESMTGDGIRDGDFVLFDQSRLPVDGDIVCAHTENGWLLKRLRTGPDGDDWVLEPSNPDYRPLAWRPENGWILWGVVVGVMRVPGPGGGEPAAWRVPAPAPPGTPDSRA